jgi:hypothetical protein
MEPLTAWERAAIRRAWRMNLFLRRLVVLVIAIGPTAVALSFLLASVITPNEGLAIFALAFLGGGMIAAASLGTATFYEGVIQKLLSVLQQTGFDIDECLSLGRLPVHHGSRCAPGGEQDQRGQERLRPRDTGRENPDGSGNVYGISDFAARFLPSEIQLIEQAIRCNVRRAKVATVIGTLFGTLLAVAWITVAIAYSWRDQLIGGMAALLFLPILAFGRTVIIRLFQIIQKMAAVMEQEGIKSIPIVNTWASTQQDR